MRIGELAKTCGVSVDTVRYYEKQGLMSSVHRSESGYRSYGHDAVDRLSFIHRAKNLGFTLNEIKELLTVSVSPEDYACSEVKQFTEEKLQQLEEKIRELQRIKYALQTLSDKCCGGDEPATQCSILDALSMVDERMLNGQEG